jgi:hypothetical protein
VVQAPRKEYCNLSKYDYIIEEVREVFFFFFFFFFFLFLNRTGTFINNLKPSPKANTTARRQTFSPKATNHGQKPEVVNRDTKSLTTKL